MTTAAPVHSHRADGSRGGLVDQLMAALGETAERRTHAWWTFLYTVEQLGLEGANAIFAEANAIEASVGLMTLDGSRRRTAGGVFLALAKKKMGAHQWVRLVERRADWRAGIPESAQRFRRERLKTETVEKP